MPKTAADFLNSSKKRTGLSFLSESERRALWERQNAKEEEEENQGGFLGGLGYAAEKVGLGFLSGIEGIWDYTAGGLAKLFGADDWAEQQFANDWVNYDHADEWFNPSEGWQLVGDVAGGIGTSAPGILGVAAGAGIAAISGGTLSPLAAGIIAGSVAGLGSAGRATKEAYDETGELGGKEFGYGALSGITEGAIEGVSSALGAGIGAVTKSITKSFGKEVAKSVGRNTLVQGVVKGFAGEAFEEGVQAILDPMYKRMTYDPNAKNATAQEVAYAALVGGLSGALMGGGDVAVRNLRGTFRGNALVNEGKASDVISTAEQLASFQRENQTDYETFQVVEKTLGELNTSLQKTGGQVQTLKQKMLLGTLEQANTSAAFEPIVSASAQNIFNNAEAVAQRMNELGYQDQNGKPLQITAEQIREGIDTTSEKKFRKTMSQALKSNSVLRTLAVADTVGQITMDTARFRDAALAGQQLSTQADLNRFTEQATDAERQAVADRLGIENWDTLTNEQFQDKITEFVANGGVQEYQQSRQFAQTAESIAPESAQQSIPSTVDALADGAYRYTQGDADIAVVKSGEAYYIYDYADKLMSKRFGRAEANAHLREIAEGEQRHSAQQNRLREQSAALDSYARENIEEYKNLSASGQAAIRATFRQGRAAGISEADVMEYAKVSAHSGVSVVFDKEASFAGLNEKGEPVYGDGYYDIEKKRLVVNPEGKRSAEKLLLHELTHAIYNGPDKTLTVAEGVNTLTEKERETIIRKYSRVGRGGAVELSDEMNAHYAERTLTNKNVLERLVQKNPTLKEKVLNFFKEARTGYKSDSKLSGAANRLYRQYKKLFDEFSARNQPYLGTENASKKAKAESGNTTGKQGESNIRMSIQKVKGGRSVVVIEDNILEGVAKKDYAAVVRQAMRKFDGGIPIGGRLIKVNAVTRNEFTWSKNTQYYRGRDEIIYQDKMKAGGHLDEIVLASTSYVNEGLKHARKDNFKEFARGDVYMKIGGNSYSAKVVVGFTGNEMVLYDVVDIQPAQFDIKKDSAKANSKRDTFDAAESSVETSVSTNSIHQKEKSVNPKSQKNKRFSLPETDSTGETLSAGQREFFKDSKVVDEKGRLLTTYHGSPNSFFTFDRGRMGKGNDQFGAGFYFATSEEASRSYGNNVHETYLNISNPIVINRTADGGDLFDVKVTQKQAYDILKRHPLIYDTESSPLGDMFEEYWEVGPKDYMIRAAAKNLDSIGLLDSDYIAFRNYPNELHEAIRDVLGYDGVEVRFDNSSDRFYVAWFENQIKLTTNKRPTSDPDIRFALSDSALDVDTEAETAVWTPDRVTDLVERYGARNPRYTQAYAAWVDPADFVKATTVNRTRLEQIYDEAGNLDIDALARESQTPYLSVDYETMRIVGHEGRHRMAALAKAGIKRVAIAVRFTEDSLSRYDAHIMDGEHTLKGQSFSSWDAEKQRTKTRTSRHSVKVGTLIPINAAYAAHLAEFTGGEYTARTAPADAEPSSYIRYALPDKQTLETLEKGETVKVYRAMQVIDGKLYPPMAARVKGADGKKEFVMPSELGRWEQADERPELIKNGNKFNLDKANGSSLDAAYNPYFHTSRSPLNDQFSSAYRRDNLITVEGEVPASELTSGYRAQYAKDPVGEMKWHSGPVSSKLPKGKERRVILSRWFKPVRVVPDAEVAQTVAEMLRGENIVVPYNVVTPSLLTELEKSGVAISHGKPSGFRFALDISAESTDARKTFSAGQRARFVANNTGMRVYSKAEAADVINSIVEERLVFEELGMYGELKGKDKRAVIDFLWQKLNTVKEGYRGGVALRIADYMIEHTVLTDMYDTVDTAESMRKLSVLRGYMHQIDLRYIQDEIKYRFDKKNTINLIWAAPKGEHGISPDTLPQLLAEEGIYLNSVNEADCFFEMLEVYEAARAEVNSTTEEVMLATYGDAQTIKKLRQDIARDILAAYEQKGKQSKFAKLIEKYTDQIATLKQKLREANANNRLINEIVDKAQKIRDLKLGTFLNSTQHNTEIFKNSIEALGKIKFRGNFNIGGTRKIMADLRTWYTKDNPLLADSYEQGIADMLDEVANGKGSYKKEELRTISDLMAYFTHFVENFNKVYRQGKWVEALPEATRYIDIMHNNEQVKVGLFRKMTGSWYVETFGDPMTVARRMDMYESGFFTEMLAELREASINAEIMEMELRQDYDAFMARNKRYFSRAAKQTIEYRGVAVPKLHLISLYMTLKRAHAQAGLAQNGFSFTDANGKRVRVDGFAPEVTEESELRAAAVEEQAAIANLLSEADKEYISILEKAFNEDAKRLKAERDMQRLGFTNATEDYYYPIRRGNIAKNVDASDIQGELDRVSSASFNKDTVRGAKQELYIESADAVFNRHIRAVTKYAALSPAIEAYNKLYNLDISGNANKPVSVATESANAWPKGNKYFTKLISDIQGISAVPSEGAKALSFIRGSYARYQLGANPKVWVTQLSSLFAATNVLDASSISQGLFVSSKDIDTYCPLAKLRARDNTAAMAQGVLDKLGKVSNVLMAPIGKMDRFVVSRLFGACQVQVQKDSGAKIGTEANKIEAGKLLTRVILETQQNSLATERSAAMRSGNEIMRTLTMFSADSMKVIGRVIDSIGELATLQTKLRGTTDTESVSSLRTQIKAAKKKVAKSIGALISSAIFMAGIAQLFNWLYNKDRDEDQTAAQQVLVDFTGSLLGGLPLARDIYTRLVEGYELDNYAYSALNDLLNSVANIFSSIEGLITGEESNTKFAARLKNAAYAVGQLLGVPTRNIYNVFYGLLKRVSPTAAYKVDEAFYAKNYVTDLNKAIEKDDTAMISVLMSMVFEESVGPTKMSDAVRNKFVELYKNGYSVLPRSIGGTISYAGVDIPLTDEEYDRFVATYAQALQDIEKMINNGTFNNLSGEKQAKAIKQVYDAYYYDALTDFIGIDERTAVGELSAWIDMSKLAPIYAGLSEITSDKDANGETIEGSKKKNTIEYLLEQDLSDGERLLILCYRGYSIQDRDYKGYAAARAKRVLLQYILKLNVSQEEKAAIAEKCGFTVRNGRIIRDF